MPPATRQRSRGRFSITGVMIVAAVALLAAPLWYPGGAPERGTLEVRSSPPVATQIRVGEYTRNQSEIEGLPLAAGAHRVCFSAPDGYVAPPCEDVDVEAGSTTRVTARFLPAGRLLVRTRPEALDAMIRVDGRSRDRGAVAIPMPEGSYRVCFEEIAGHQTPACQSAGVVAGRDTVIEAEYER